MPALRWGAKSGGVPRRSRLSYEPFAAELRLLDDLGWEQEPDAKEFELTMPPRQLRPVIERVYWSAVASLNNETDELVDEAVTHLSDATVACPELLARLADDYIARESPTSASGASNPVAEDE